MCYFYARLHAVYRTEAPAEHISSLGGLRPLIHDLHLLWPYHLEHQVKRYSSCSHALTGDEQGPVAVYHPGAAAAECLEVELVVAAPRPGSFRCSTRDGEMIGKQGHFAETHPGVRRSSEVLQHNVLFGYNQQALCEDNQSDSNEDRETVVFFTDSKI